MRCITIDFETKSDIDIEYGVSAYVRGQQADILMMAYKVNDEPTKVWFPGDELPIELYDPSYKVVAHNADFEMEVIEQLGYKYNFPEIPLERWIDTAALCRRYGFPASLEEAGKILKLPIQKDTNGKALIKLFCCPPFGLKEINAYEWNLFVQYCAQDVETTRLLHKTLPAMTLSPEEFEIWKLTRIMNVRGVPIDIESAKQIYQLVTAFLEENNQRLPELTGGKVSKVTQVKRIKDWINEELEIYGVNVDSLRAEIITELLTLDLPDNVTEVLEIRAGTGASSIGKYKRMVNMAIPSNIGISKCHIMPNNSIYYGAHTGRITGSGFQLLNLPRASVDDPELEIQKFFNYDILDENPVLSARALIRPMIKAPKGYKLLVSDYSSVEFIMLVYLAGDKEAVKKFAEGLDQYKDLGAYLYGIPYGQVNKQQRQHGKTGILGCGYGLGAAGFIGYAKRMGLEADYEQAKFIVDGYRNKYKLVKQMWRALHQAAMQAIDCRGQVIETHKTKFEYRKDKSNNPWLIMTLPSGRNMFYFDPRVDQGKFGPTFTHMGRNQVTKQWERREVSPGLITENVVQAVCRDLLYYGKMQLEKAGYPLIASIYDEVISVVPEDFGSVEEFENLMASVPPWAPGLPLRSEGFSSTRYKKG